jgi:hypothetical protein
MLVRVQTKILAYICLESVFATLYSIERKVIMQMFMYLMILLLDWQVHTVTKIF